MNSFGLIALALLGIWALSRTRSAGRYNVGDRVEVFILGGWTQVTIIGKSLGVYHIGYGYGPGYTQEAYMAIAEFDALESHLVTGDI